MTTVVDCTSADAAAPGLSGSAGSLIGVCDAVLINGFNLRTIASINVTSSIGTATTTADHGYLVGNVLLQAGATPAGLNGRFRVLSVPSSNTYTFAATGAPNGAATGAMNVRRAPAGWVKLFSGTNKAVYRSGDPTASQCVVRIENATSFPSMRGYESMTTVDAGTNPFPTVAQASSAVQFSAAFSGVTDWAITADAKSVHIKILDQTISFGDYLSPSPAEVLCFTLMAWTAFSASSYPWVPRSNNGALPALKLDKTDARQGTLTFPSPLTGGVDFSPVQIFSPECHRGLLRGAYYSEQVLSDNQVLSGALPGRVFIARVFGGVSSVVDITGPW